MILLDTHALIWYLTQPEKMSKQSTRLPGKFHRDPVDRLLVATSIDLGAPLVTKDERIHRYPHVQTIW